MTSGEKLSQWLVAGALFALAAPFLAHGAATKIHQRYSFGGYAATERYKNDSSSGTDSNDFAILSGRAFLRVHDWGESKWEFVSDLRDKHDFFDKLDKERLTLNARNELQVRQLSLRRPNPSGFWSPQAGRFAVPEAGAVFVDGAQIENHWTKAVRTSVFGGLNPKQDADSYLKFNSEANVYGGNLTIQSQTGGWHQNFYSSTALVEKTYGGHRDRQYLFENLNYQWSRDGRFLGLLYLDFIPRSYVQTANAILQQGISQSFAIEAQGLMVDAIEYSRRQGVLERLPSSPYREGSLQVTLLPGSTSRLFVKGTYGKRQVDQLDKNEVMAGWSGTGFISPKWDLRAAGGVRKNFTSDDQFARGGLGYFSRKWESTLDVDFSAQTYATGQVLHPLITELTLANYYSRRTYSTLAFQHAADEDKTIMSVFFRVGFQFSNQEVPPVRDGAPPRGAL